MALTRLVSTDSTRLDSKDLTKPFLPHDFELHGMIFQTTSFDKCHIQRLSVAIRNRDKRL